MSDLKKHLYLLVACLANSIFAYGSGFVSMKHSFDGEVLKNDTVKNINRTDTLQELLVTAETIEHNGRTDTYLITKTMKEDTHDAGDLIGKISGMHYNPLSKELKYLGSSNVILLVDSLEKDSEYIKRLNPNRFLKINVTNNPAGKYAGYDAVINLVTRPSYIGYDGTALSEVHIRPGDRNGDGKEVSGWREILEATYTRNNWNFAFSGNYTGARQGEGVSNREDFPLNNYSQTTPMPSLANPNKFVHENFASFKLWADYTISKRHSLSLGVSVSPSSLKIRRDEFIISQTDGKDPVPSFQNIVDRNRDQLGLNAILQYRGMISKWSLNASVQFSNVSYDRLHSLTRGSFTLNDDRDINSQYVWGGVDASKWLNSKFSLSLSDYATWIGYKESELSSGRKLSSSNDFRNRFMASIQFFPSKKWSAGADLGINVSRTGANGEYKSHVTPRFGINGMWTSSKVMFRLNYTATTRNVALSQEQDYGSFTDSLIYHCGNPLLSPSLAHNVNAMVNILRVLTISGRFTRTHNAIFDIVESGNGMRPDGIVGNYASFQYQNGNSTIWKGNISYNQTFKKSWTISVTASIMKERASFGSYSSSKTLPEYDWYVMYNNSKAALQAYLSSSLHTTLFVTPQQLSWGQYDGYSLSLVKFLFSYKLQLMAMWRMPFHFIKEPTKSELTSPAYVLHTTYDTYRRSENQLTFTVVWRFQGGKKTRKYNRQEESVDLY